MPLAADECSPRWWVLLIGAWSLAAAGAGLLHWRPEWAVMAWPDPVFMLAFAAALRCRGREFGIFLACGLLRDVWLGGRLGAGALLYAAAGAILSTWRRRGALPDMPGPWWWAGVVGLIAFLPRETVEWASFEGWSQGLARGALTAFWTAILYPLADWWLDVPAWRPWHGPDGRRR